MYKGIKVAQKAGSKPSSSSSSASSGSAASSPRPVDPVAFPALTAPAVVELPDAFSTDAYTDISDGDQQQQYVSTDVTGDVLATLATLFPALDVELLDDQLIVVDGDLQNAIDAILNASGELLSVANESAKASEGRGQRSQRRMVIHSVSSSSSNPTTQAAMQEVSFEGPRIVDVSGHIPQRMVSENETSQVLREQANQIAQRRNMAYSQAAQMHRRGDWGRAAAGYYAQVGHEHNSRMHEVNQDAAWQTVLEHRLYRHPTSHHTENRNMIDLHHVRVPEAIVILNEELPAWFQREARGSRNPDAPLRIITGVGRIGRNGQSTARLQPAIARYLLREGWHFETGDGFFIVQRRA